MRYRWIFLRALAVAAMVGASSIGQAQSIRWIPLPPSTYQPGPNRTSFDRDNRVTTDPTRPNPPEIKTPLPPGFPFGLEWGSWAPAGAGASGSPDPGFRNTPPQYP